MKKYPYMAHNAAFEDSWFKIHLTVTPRHAARVRSSSSTRARSAAAWTPTCARSPRVRPRRARELGTPSRHPRARRQRAASGSGRHRPHAPHGTGRVQPQEPVCEITDPSAGAPARHSAIRLDAPARSKLGRSLMAAPSFNQNEQIRMLHIVGRLAHLLFRVVRPAEPLVEAP